VLYFRELEMAIISGRVCDFSSQPKSDLTKIGSIHNTVESGYNKVYGTSEILSL
jgi:hypothetical protein